MGWVLGAVLLAGLGALGWALTVRFNQLSMNRSLTDEARRQYVYACRSRHGLVPTYAVAAREVLGDVVETHRLEGAARAAQQPAVHRGPAEYRLTLCIAEVAARIRAEASDPQRSATASRALAYDLVRQLRIQETHIGAAVRHHNSSVQAYEDRRILAGSLPWRWIFRPVPGIDYAPAEDERDPEPSVSDPEAAFPGSENYRPGRVSEDL
ncbi:hypothetical protein [Brevibacterium album]|uniref:hypothetical protein n=1 Tax=Brevibacterium album TaxID=417948 RepID=UPI000409CD9F|nr:hypothetical protein [Brevibacterium album]